MAVVVALGVAKPLSNDLAPALPLRLKKGDRAPVLGTDRVGDDAPAPPPVGDDPEIMATATSGRSSHRCFDESNTLRFLVATFWQTFRCLSNDSGLKVRKQIGQGRRISGPCGSSSTVPPPPPPPPPPPVDFNKEEEEEDC